MAIPQRLQLSREKGFNLQSHSESINGLEVVNVARPSKWGNPYPVRKEGPGGRIAPDNEGAVGFFRMMLSDAEMCPASYPMCFEALRGKNLACWCGPREFCHADVLLELANSTETE